MKKITSDYQITGSNYRWGDNKITGEKSQTPDHLPHSGEQVRQYIGTKVGAWTVSDNVLYAFENENDRDTYLETLNPSLLLPGFDPIELGSGSGVSIDFRVTSSHEGDIFINGDNAYNMPIYVKSVIVEDGVENPYDTVVNAELLVTIDGSQTTYSLGRIEANKTVNINVTPYVADGANIRFRAYNDSGYARTTAAMWKVTRASMLLTPQNDVWWTEAFVNGNTEWGVPLTIDSNVPCKMVISLTDKDGVQRSSAEIPSSDFSTNYFLKFAHPTLMSGESGIYHLTIELVATAEELQGLKSIPLNYDICCVKEGESHNYLIVNNHGENFKNYTTNKMFDYAVYVGYGSPKISFTAKEDDVVVATTGNLEVRNKTKYTYNLPLDMERLDDADFNINITSTLGTDKVYDKIYTFSNKDGYAATSGANVLVRFSGRSNTETNREVITNIIDGEPIQATFEGVGWTAEDGYRVDNLGDTQQAYLRLLPSASLDLGIKPLLMNANEGRTLEIDFRVHSIFDYTQPIIRCLTGDDDTFNGLKITPETIELRAVSAQNKDDQNTGIEEDTHVRIAIVVRPLPNGASANVDNFSRCAIYIDGCLVKEFAYNRDLSTNSNLLFGSEYAGIDIFGIRTYNVALTNREVETNACNWQSTEADKKYYKEHNNVRENGVVDYVRTRAMHNVIVFKSDVLPARNWSKSTKTSAEISFFDVKDPTNNYVHKVDDFTWQGTTSHNYGTADGIGQNYKWTGDGTKMCAKANWASSMQSHKMGLTAAYTDLARRCNVIGEDDPRLSIYQLPAAGFWEKDGKYIFIGLFTVGADKGNKKTFGFGSNSIAMEGKDNEPLGTNYLTPWNDDTVTTDGETYAICGVDSWEDAMKNTNGVETRWKPAYNFVYGCSQYIEPYTGGLKLVEYSELVDTYNTMVQRGDETTEQFEARKAQVKAQYEAIADQYGVPANEYSYWFTEADVDTPAYELFYYNGKTKRWTDSGINVKDVLVSKNYLTYQKITSNAEDPETLNEIFKEARRAMFKAEMTDYFDLNCALFHNAFIEFNACTDNLAKNTYPFMLDVTDPNARIMYRQDDLDSSFTTENQGKNYKQYCVEFLDNYEDYGRNNLAVWNGTQNQFWLLMRECFEEEQAEFMRSKFIESMAQGAGTASAVFEAFCKAYFYDKAQYHFAEALYNETSRIRYEMASLESGYQYRGIALSQNCGNHLQAERRWLKMRYIYMCSKYLAGNFRAGSVSDVFVTRPLSDDNGNTFEITPAIYMYPSVQNGQSVERGYRIYPPTPNKTWVHTMPKTLGDQEQRINGMSYIRSLGAMYNAAIGGKVDVNGRMLTGLDLGTLTDLEHIRSKITGVGIGDAILLKRLVFANLSTLAGVIDLSACSNLRELYAEGTAVNGITLADSNALRVLHLPSTINVLSLKGKTQLEDLQVDGVRNITDIEVENCNKYTYDRVFEIIEQSLNRGYKLRVYPQYENTPHSFEVNGQVVTGEFNGEFDNGEKVTIKVTGEDNYVFDRWFKDDVFFSTDSQITIDMDADHEMMAKFKFEY